MRKGIAGTFSSYTFLHLCLNYVNTLPIKTKRKKNTVYNLKRSRQPPEAR